MLTRCPACTTTFRVTPEQLKARLGKVRCGQCTTVFNALDSLVEENKPGQTLAEAAESSHAEASPEHTLEEPLAPDTMPTATPSDEEVVGPESGETAPADALAAPIGERAAEQPPPPIAMDDASASRDGALPAEPTHSLKDFTQGTPVQDEPAAEKPGVVHAVTDMRAAFGLPVIEEQPKPARPDARKALWISALALAACLLVGQILIHFRGEIAQRQPALKPLLLATCRMLGCEVPLPQQPTLLSLEGSNLYPNPAHKEQLVLVATIHNRASFAQQFPYLELSLTDVNNRRLAVRAFKPRDYLPAAVDPAKGLAADEEITVNLTLDPQGLPVAGYLVYIFYP